MKEIMKYRDYKQMYSDCKTVYGSYNSTNKTITVIIPEGHSSWERYQTVLSLGKTMDKLYHEIDKKLDLDQDFEKISAIDSDKWILWNNIGRQLREAYKNYNSEEWNNANAAAKAFIVKMQKFLDEGIWE